MINLGAINSLVMKKILLASAFVALTASCSPSKAPKILVLYYSQTATTRAVAEEIGSRLGADIEALVPAVPYDGDFQATVNRGLKEREEGTVPEIQPLAANLEAYDYIFLGYPVWFGTYAPPIAGLLEAVNLDGKKIVPFCTFGSGGLDTSVKDLKAKLPNAEILPGYGVRAARIDAMPAEIDRFLKAGGFLEGEVPVLEEFSEVRPVTKEESAIFDAAVGDYPMIHAQAEEVSSRPVSGGTEYLFTARDLPRDPALEMPVSTMKVYVLAEDGKAPVFTQVVR